MGLQRLGEQDPPALLSLLRSWLAEASLMDRRAILLCLAHPPLLEHTEAVEMALDLAEACLQILEADSSADQHDESSEPLSPEDRHALRKCLEFAPSVYTAADPTRGFAQLRRWASRESIATKRIVVLNLRKARLARHFPQEVEDVASELGAGSLA